MPDTIRTENQLLSIFADNSNEEISEQDIRDLVVSATIDEATDHFSNTNNPHGTSFNNINSGTLADLNSVISDATLSFEVAPEIVTSNSQSMSAGVLYIANNESESITFQLPATPSVGETFMVTGIGQGGWSITSGSAGQIIKIGSETSVSSPSTDYILLKSNSPEDAIWITYAETNIFVATIHKDGDLKDEYFKLQQKLVGTGPAGRIASDWFGRSVSISGNTCVIGAILQDYDAAGINFVSNTGAVFVYTRSGTDWTFQQKLIGEGTNGRVSGDNFGYSIHIDNDTIVIGSPFQNYNADGSNSETDAGAAYIYTRSGSTWTLQQKIVGEGTNGRSSFDSFGYSVSINNNTCVVGAYAHDYDASGSNWTTGTGAAFIYTRSGATWNLEQKLVAEGTNGRVFNTYFGLSVSVHGDTCAVGARSHTYDANGANYLSGAGAAFIFTRIGTTWSLQQRLSGSGTNGRVSGDEFGGSISIHNDTCVIGAHYQDYDDNGANLTSGAGAAYIYTRSGTTWTLQQKIVGEGTNGRIADDYFGESVDIHEDICVIGAYRNGYDQNGGTYRNKSGSAYVYVRDGSTWSMQKKLTGTIADGRTASDYFGRDVAVNDGTCVSGAYSQNYDENGDNILSGAGAAYVFNW